MEAIYNVTRNKTLLPQMQNHEENSLERDSSASLRWLLVHDLDDPQAIWTPNGPHIQRP